MEQPGTFRTAMFGFNKKSVLQYIDELSQQNRETEERLKRELEELENKNRELDTSLTQTAGQLRAMVEDARQNGDRIRDLEDQVDGLAMEVKEEKTAMEGKERELRQQQERCRQLTLRAESLEYKGRKYDESVAQIGSAFLEAQQSAQIILRNAEQKASQLTLTAMESIQGLAQQIKTFKGDVNALRGTLQNSMHELERRLDEIDHSIDTLDAAVKAAEQFGEESEPEERADASEAEQQGAGESAPEPSVEKEAPDATREPTAAEQGKFFW